MSSAERSGGPKASAPGESLGRTLLFGPRQRSPVAFWLFLLLSAVYLLNYQGQIHSADEVSMLVVAKNLLKQRSFDATAQIWAQQVNLPTPQESFGPDGLLYSKKGPGEPLLLAPLVAIGDLAWPVSPVQAAFLLNVFVTALTAVLLFESARLLGLGERVAAAGALLFGLATPALPYAKYLFNEPLAGMGILGGVYGLLVWERRHSQRGLWLAAVALALAAAVRQEALVVFVSFGLFVLWVWSRRTTRTVSDLLAFGVPLALAAGALVGYNLVTSGAIYPGQYQVTSAGESFSTPLLEGLYGLWLSPGKGLLVYAPVLLFMLPGLALLWSQRRDLALLLVGIVVCYASLHALFRDWWGGTAWGPRPLVPLIPLCALLMTLGIARALRARAGRWLAVALAAISAAIALLGATVNFLDYAALLSGIRPDAEWTIGVYSLADSPILGHLRLMGQRVPDFAWAAATGSGWTVQWALLLILLLLVLSAGLALWRALFGAAPGRAWQAGAAAAWIGCAGVLLGDVYQRPTLEDADGWRALAQAVQARAGPGDVLLDSAPAGRMGLLYYDKSALRWYHFSEEPAPLLPRTQAYVERYVGDSARVWLATWKTPETNPNRGFEAWLAERYYQPAQWDWGKPARLLLFERVQGAPEPGPDVLLGNVVRLSGAQVERRVLEAGSPLCVRLRWQVQQAPDDTLVEFLHLVDGGGRVRAQVDREPVGGWRPAAGWHVGDTFDDPVVLQTGDELEPGTYQLLAGVYRYPSLARLAVPGSADNTVDLGSIQVKTAGSHASTGCYAN